MVQLRLKKQWCVAFPCHSTTADYKDTTFVELPWKCQRCMSWDHCVTKYSARTVPFRPSRQVVLVRPT